ncbi:MAG TPA: glycosyltransferase [Cyclobacteriaceae bacterium]|nr:glycosyltransferase [Cyclobacteriaceae bacterium]
MMTGVSVIICCYNSTRRINETLRHLRAQSSTVSWEIILVDNASTDGTAEMAKKIWSEQPQPASLIVIDAPQPGLVQARAAGLTAAAGPIVIFCDDDNWLDTNYIQRAHELMMEFPDAGVAGGWCDGAYEVPLPPHLEAMRGALSIGKQSNRDGEVTAVFGAGMVIRKVCFETISGAGKSLVEDRKGKVLTSGGDTELCYRALFAGYRVRFSDSLHFMHFMPKERLDERYLLSLCLRHVGPTLTLSAYDAILKDAGCSYSRFFFQFILRRVGMAFHYLPRMLVGRHRFYSVVFFLQSWKLTGLILLRWVHYSVQFRRIREIRSKLGVEKL